MSNEHTSKLHSLSLGNLGQLAEGKLEAQFQTQLEDIDGIADNLEQYQTNKHGAAKVTVKITLELEVAPDGLGIRAWSEMTRPKPVAYGRNARRQHGGGYAFVEDTHVQGPLFSAVPRTATGGASDDE